MPCRAALGVGEFGQDRDAVACQPLAQPESRGLFVGLRCSLDDEGTGTGGNPGDEPALRVVSQHGGRGRQEVLRAGCPEPAEAVVPEPAQVGAQRPVLLDAAGRDDGVRTEGVRLDQPDTAGPVRACRPSLQFDDVLRGGG